MVVLFYIGVVVAISVKGWNRVNNTSIETIYRTQSCEQQFPLTLRRLRYSTFTARATPHRMPSSNNIGYNRSKASNSIPSGHVCGFKNGYAPRPPDEQSPPTSLTRQRRPILHSSLEVHIMPQSKVADKDYKARLSLSEVSSNVALHGGLHFPAQQAWH